MPYSLKGWSESVDLTKEDPKELEKEVVNTYLTLLGEFEAKNHKTVCLLRTDLRYKGQAVVRVGYTNEKDRKRLYYYGFIFHRPYEGAPLEPIR